MQLQLDIVEPDDVPNRLRGGQEIDPMQRSRIARLLNRDRTRFVSCQAVHEYLVAAGIRRPPPLE